MEIVVSNHIGELDKDMARAIILLASNEMTKVKVWGIPALAWLTCPWLGQGRKQGNWEWGVREG